MAKKFRVATEGATTDDRKIQREWITQMAETYDPKKYGARVWLEHLRGLFADGPAPALGDVVAVAAEEVEDGKLALFAEIDPTEKLKALNKDRQKIYSSIEVNPNFAGTGKAYLEGLAVTDSPASLGTDMLKFSAGAGSNSPLAARKQNPENLFSAVEEVDLDFSEEPEKPGLGNLVKNLFKKHDDKTNKGFEAFRDDLKDAFEQFAGAHKELAADVEKRPSAEQFSELKKAHEKLQGQFDDLYRQLDNTPDQPGRKSTGAQGDLTDC